MSEAMVRLYQFLVEMGRISPEEFEEKAGIEYGS